MRFPLGFRQSTRNAHKPSAALMIQLLNYCQYIAQMSLVVGDFLQEVLKHGISWMSRGAKPRDLAWYRLADGELLFLAWTDRVPQDVLLLI